MRSLPAGAASRLGRSIAVLRENVGKPVRVADLAEIANMSASSFNAHLEAFTGMTPVGYGKDPPH